MNLDELQRLAELASVLPWESSPSDVPYAHKKQFQDAMSPDTAKKLIAVARAAADLNESAMSLALFTALEELKHG